MSSQIIQSDVCIVGDGAVGKAAALGFSQAGLRVNVLSSMHPTRNEALNDDWDVRVFALNHVAHDLLDSLKVWGALVQQRIAPVKGMRVMDAAGSVKGDLSFDAYGAYLNELAWIVEDANLNRALDAALEFSPNIIRVVGDASQLEVNSHGATVMLSTGEKIVAKLIVGADGAQSWVRSQCDIGMDYRSYHQQGVVTNFACEKPHHGVAHQWFVQELGIIALLPLPENRVSLVWSAPDTLANEILQEPLEALAQRLATYCADVLGKLTPLQPAVMKAFPLRLMRPHSMIAPRVALIGDAAHVVHPLAGHGMNLGFGDVKTLLNCICTRESYRDCGDEKVLSRYRRARREEVALMQWTTDGLSRLFHSQFPAARFLRNAGLNFVNQIPLLKRALISQAVGK